jgi:hypothetical protein
MEDEPINQNQPNWLWYAMFVHQNSALKGPKENDKKTEMN